MVKRRQALGQLGLLLLVLTFSSLIFGNSLTHSAAESFFTHAADEALYIHDEGYDGPLTIQTRMTFHEEGTAAEDGVWLAGFASDADGTPTALGFTFAPVSSGWLGSMWGLQLQSDADVLTGRVSTLEQEGVLEGTQHIALETITPQWGHEYEATLGYDPASGATTIRLVDLTSDEVVIARSLQLKPYDGLLYPAAGVPEVEGGMGSAALNTISLFEHVIPQRLAWWIMQKPQEHTDYVSVQHVDRRHDTALSVHSPWDSMPGRLMLSLRDADDEEYARVVYDEDSEFTPFILSEMTAGAYRGILLYEQDGNQWELDERALRIGVIETDVRSLTLHRVGDDTVRLEGVLHITSDGPVDASAVGLVASVTQHDFVYDRVRGEGEMKEEALTAMHVVEPSPVEPFPEAAIPFQAHIPLQAAANNNTLWNVRLTPQTLDHDMLLADNVHNSWLGVDSATHDWSGFLQNESITVTELAPGIELVHLQGNIPAGPAEMFVVAADLDEPGVYADALVGADLTTPASSRWPRSQPSQMVEATGAIAGVNAAFFDISDTMQPLGIVMQSGDILKTDRAGYDAAIGITKEGTAHLGYWQWSGGVQRVDGTGYRSLAGLNMKSSSSRLSLKRWPTLKTEGTLNAEQPVVELVIEEIDASGETANNAETKTLRGVVRQVRHGLPGINLQPGMMVLSGRGEDADYLLETFQEDDIVEVVYRLVGASEWPSPDNWQSLRAAISGGAVLLTNGAYASPDVTRNKDRHPRTAIGISWDQSKLFMLVVDGRSQRSVGMTYAEMANFFRHIGAFHALNLDGGGSTGLAILHPATQRVEVVNTPSDGRQRYVPDGLGVFYSAP